MRPFAFGALVISVLAGAARAGQIEAPVSGQSAPGAQSGALGSSLAAPNPIRMTVPSLTGASAPTLASALAPSPSLVQPAAVQPAAVRPLAAQPAPVPVLPKSAVTPAGPRTIAASLKAAPAAPDGPAFADAGRALFDQASAPGSLRSVVRRGESRGEGWEVDGKPARRLSAGGFKEVLIHPSDPRLVIKLFSQTGAKDAAGSLAEKRLEMNNLQPLLSIDRAPRVIEQGGLKLQTPNTGGQRITGYIVQERVAGRELGDMLKDPDPAVRARAMKEARALFEELIAARIKLEDRVKMHENISVGRAGRRDAVKAWVLDAGEATLLPERGVIDKLLGRPDPLRAYYDAVLAELSRLPRR